MGKTPIWSRIEVFGRDIWSGLCHKSYDVDKLSFIVFVRLTSAQPSPQSGSKERFSDVMCFNKLIVGFCLIQQSQKKQENVMKQSVIHIEIKQASLPTNTTLEHYMRTWTHWWTVLSAVLCWWWIWLWVCRLSYLFSSVSLLLVFSLLSGSLVVCSCVFSWLNFLPSLPAVRRDPPLYGRSLTTCLFMSPSVCTLISSVRVEASSHVFIKVINLFGLSPATLSDNCNER